MKKYICLLAILFIPAVSALELETISQFSGDVNSAHFYVPINDDYKVVAGFKTTLTTRADQVDFSLLIGLNHDIPILGNADMYFLNTVDSVETAVGKRKFKTYSFNIAKQWMYSVNESILLGVEVIFVSLKLQGEADKLHILTDAYPVLGVTIDF
jgi:hypothetical protein